MRGFTSAMLAAVREARASDERTVAVPLHTLDELAEYLTRVDKLIQKAEDVVHNYEWWMVDTYDRQAPSDDIAGLKDALAEVAS